MNVSPINLQEEYAKTEIAKILNLLDEELVGLVPVKSRIREIAALLLVDKLAWCVTKVPETQVY